MDYKHIVVGVDFSPCSAEALKDAVRLGRSSSAQISAVHILDREVMDYLNGHTVVDEDRTRKEAQARLDDFVGKHAEGWSSVESLLVVGHPFADLVKICATKEADLLLLGSRGHGNDGGHLGVIASKCLRKAPLPVLLAQDRQGDPIRQVVCCVDYSATSKSAVAHAIQVAKLEGAALDFLNVYASPYTYQETGTGYISSGLVNAEDFGKIMQQNLKNYLAAFEEDCQGLDTTQTVLDRISMGRGIIDRLAEINGDLLVIGTRGRTGWKKLLLGTTAEYVVHRAPCSLLAVKPEGFDYVID